MTNIKKTETLTYKNETRTIAEWAKRYAGSPLYLTEDTIRNRIRREWPVEKIMTKANKAWRNSLQKKDTENAIKMMIEIFMEDKTAFKAWFREKVKQNRDDGWKTVAPFFMKMLESELKTKQEVAKSEVAATQAPAQIVFNLVQGAPPQGNVFEIE